MGKATHDGWEGFTKLRDARGIIVKALCNTCNKEFVRRDAASLKAHKERACPGIARDRSPLSVRGKVSNNKENVQASPSTEEELPTSSISSGKLSLPPSTSFSLAPNESLDAKEIDILFLRFLMFCNVEFEKIDSFHCKNFLNALNPTYKVPDSEKMKTEIVNSAFEKLTVDSKSGFLNLIGVVSFDSIENNYAISFGMNVEREYVYLNYTLLNDCESDLHTFFKASVAKANETFAISVKFVIYEGKIKTDKSGALDTGECYDIILSFDTLIKKLRHEHAPFIIENENDLDKLCKYNKVLDDFKEKLDNEYCSIAFATEHLFELLNDNLLSINLNVMDEILNLLHPVCLAINYLDPNCKGNRFIFYEEFKTSMYKYFHKVEPKDSQFFKGLADYKHANNQFKVLYADSDSYDCERFWSFASMDYPSLSQYAMEIINLPVNMKKLNLQRLKKSIVQYKNTENDAFMVVLMSIFLNE